MLRWCRSQATWMLIIFGALLMAIFGLGPVFDQMTRGIQSSGGGENTVIGKWRNGDITRFQLDDLRRRHYASQRFLQELRAQAVKQCEEKGVQYKAIAMPIQPIVERNDAAGYVDEQLIERILLAERAKEEGVVVSDGMIVDYLAYTAGTEVEFSRNDLKQINRLANPNGTALGDIREHLKMELMAQQMKTFTSVGIAANPVPTEAVELYARANQTIECEVVPVSVGKYVSMVKGEPSRTEIQELYEKGKYEYKDPTGVRPGFRIPRKVNVQYFVMDYENLLKSEQAGISDEQVQIEYDRLVEEKDPMVMELSVADDLESFEVNVGDGDDAKGDDAKGDDTDDDTENKAKDAAADAEDATDAEEDATEANKDDQSHNVTRQKAVAVSYRQEESPAQEVGEAVEKAVESAKEMPLETQEDEKEAVEKTGSEMPAKKTEETPAPTVADQDKATMPLEPAGEKQDEQEGEIGGLGGMKLAGEGDAAVTAGDAPMQAKPLADVADRIRESLARKPAFDKRTDSMKRAKLALENYQGDFLRWETSGAKPDEKPLLPNFKEIAQSNGMEYRETGLVGPEELQQSELGEVQFLVNMQSPGGGPRFLPQVVSNQIYRDFDRSRDFVPNTVQELGTFNGYLYWIAEREDDRVAELDESRDEIVKFWKSQEAVKLAMDEAQKMADRANSEGKRLTALYPDSAAPTGEFVWFRPGAQARATYGNPVGVDNAAEEFMSTAFGLDLDKTGVAANEVRDTVYVVQRISEPKTLAEAGSEYLTEKYFRFKRVPTDVIGGVFVYAQEADDKWNEDFVKSMGYRRVEY